MFLQQLVFLSVPREDGIREDDDLYVLRYNQALLCVQLRHYAQARSFRHSARHVLRGAFIFDAREVGRLITTSALRQSRHMLGPS